MSRAATKTKPAEGATLFGAAAPEQKPAAKPTATKPKAAAPRVAPQAQAVVPLRSKSNPTNTLAVIADALKDPNFKPESMRMVLDMHKEMIAEQARLDFIEAMRDLKRKLPTINRDGLIQYRDKGDGKGKPKPLAFASFQNIHQVITPLLDEFGFDLWFSSEPGAAGMLNVIGNLEHKNGARRQTVFPMPHDASGGKSASQGWASAFSFGKRTATIGLLNILTMAPEDRDLDGNRPKVTKGGKPQVIDGDAVVVEDGVATVAKVSKAQVDVLAKAIGECGVGVPRVLTFYDIEKLADLPAAKYDDAIAACKKYALDNPKAKS